ncbi:MAG: hypothetical protein HND48_18535 [Chloroflexi bacterium]|nr:hypothetical protein [Chloroflexota bacterium]
MLDELERLIERLSPKERAELFARLAKPIPSDTKPKETRVRAFEAAVDALKEGLTSTQIEELEWAMNVETSDSDGEIL